MMSVKFHSVGPKTSGQDTTLLNNRNDDESIRGEGRPMSPIGSMIVELGRKSQDYDVHSQDAKKVQGIVLGDNIDYPPVPSLAGHELVDQSSGPDKPADVAPKGVSQPSRGLARRDSLETSPSYHTIHSISHLSLGEPLLSTQHNELDALQPSISKSSETPAAPARQTKWGKVKGSIRKHFQTTRDLISRNGTSSSPFSKAKQTMEQETPNKEYFN